MAFRVTGAFMGLVPLPGFPISHTMSLIPSRPRAQVRGWLSGCCRLLVIARESFIQCNDLYFFFFGRSCGSSGSAPSGGGGVDCGGEWVNAWLCTMSSSANLLCC